MTKKVQTSTLSNLTSSDPLIQEAISTLTPFGAHKIVNKILSEHASPLINKLTIRPQMMYNYTTNRTNKNLKPFIPTNELGRIELEDLVVWTNKYITKKLSHVTPTE